MLEPAAALDRLDTALAAARTAGADSADALYVGEASTGIGVRLGTLEDIGRSEGEEIGIRVFIGSRSASVSSSDLSAAALTAAVERAVAMARLAPEDRYAGLAPADRLAPGPLPDLDVNDPTEPSAEQLRDLALAAEDAARAVPGVTNSEGGSATLGRGVTALATSTGFRGARQGSSFMIAVSVIAGGQGGGSSDMQRDYAYASARHFADLESPEAIGSRAGTRAVARLAPIKLDTGALPIVFDPRVGGSLLGHLMGAISGSAVARGTSFLKDALGTAIFDSGITVIDDPLRRRGLRSRAFDGEGLAAHTTTIIDAGVLTGWLMDSASARQLGLAPTGHASRGTGGPPGVSATNLHMAAGGITPAALLAGIPRGFYVTEMIGMGVNPVTGDYSRGASGFLIEDGELTRPVAEVTIAGNLRDMFKNLIAADDLTFRYATNTPTLRIDGMTVAGA